MKLKSLLIVTLLAGVSCAAFNLQSPSESAGTDPRVGHPLSQGSTIEQAVKLRLSDQGKTVTLVRQTDGTWRVASYFDFPADFKKLSALVASLTKANIQRLVTTSAESIAQLEFKDAKIDFLDKTDHTLLSITLGKTTDLGTRYVRFDNEQKAYLAGFTAWLDADSINWVDRQILNLKPEEIASADISLADGSSVKISRAKKEEPWKSDKTPTGQQVSASKISTLLTSTGSIHFFEATDPADPNAVAAKAHARVFKLTTFEGKTYTAALGRKPQDKTPQSPALVAGPVFIFVTSSDSAATINGLMQKRAFQISDYAFTSLPQKRADLFEPIPPPAPAAPAAPPAPAPPNNAKPPAPAPAKK